MTIEQNFVALTIRETKPDSLCHIYIYAKFGIVPFVTKPLKGRFSVAFLLFPDPAGGSNPKGLIV